MAEINTIIDLSHHNCDVDLVCAKTAGILGVIQKATQGAGYKDPTFNAKPRASYSSRPPFRGLPFRTGDDGVAQAEHFLSVANGAKDLVVLDFERNPHGPSMTLEEARAFVIHIREKAG